MEVKQGYKQTDIGIIPEDWDADAVESTTPPNRPNGIVDGPFGSNLKTIHYRKSGIPIITSGYVTEGKFFASEYLYVDKEKFRQEKRSAVNPGDIVMAKIGARCGASAILPKDHEVGILSGNALKITVDNSRHSTYYIWQVLWNLYLKGDIDELRTVGAQPAISMANLKKYKISLPPLPEQEAIAEALSDAEALIEALEGLIAKKRQVKQGAMQELLTGKRRLPEFSSEWEDKRLGELSEMGSGGTPLTSNPNFYDGDIPWVSITDMTNGGKFITSTERNLTTAGLNNSSAQMFPAGTVLYAMYASLGECSIADVSLCTSQAILGIRAKPNLHNEFLYYFFTYFSTVQIRGKSVIG